jgi:hypothetical protein
MGQETGIGVGNQSMRFDWEAVPFIKWSLKGMIFKVRLCCDPQRVGRRATGL